MENVNILNQMAQYDFRTPINVTMIFEDSEDESSTNIEHLDEIKSLNSETKTENTSTKDKVDVQNSSVPVKEVVINADITKHHRPVDCEDKTCSRKEKTRNRRRRHPNRLEATSKVTYTEKRIDIMDEANKISNSQDTNNDVHDIDQQNRDKEELTIYIKDLLNTLSEHLILIMQNYYHFHRQNHNPVVAAQLSEQLKKLKEHFFDLSYSTVVSLILRHEQNQVFIKQFLDKTAADANKVLGWKCERKHVEPFYYEMITWAKQKRQYIKTLNETRAVRERLNDAPRPFNYPHPTGTHNKNYKQMSITDNSMCIFSSGAPGQEISINVNPDTLLKHNARHQNQNKQTQIANEIHRNRNIDVHLPIIAQSTPRQIVYNHQQRSHDGRENQSASLLGPSSAYGAPNYVSRTYSTTNHTSSPYGNPIRNTPPPSYGNPTFNSSTPIHNTNGYQLNTMYENIAQTMQMQAERNSFTEAMCNSNSSFRRMCNTQIETQNIITPIITNVTSLKTAPTHGRCRICGKNTDSIFSYCSYLCQELHLGVQKTAPKKQY